MKVYFGTNKGKVRDINEDNYLLTENDSYILYAVADGMGGHNAGEIASEIAVNSLKELFDDQHVKLQVPAFINKSIIYANEKIIEQADKNDNYLGMGTTLTMAVIDKIENILYVGNVGDSRVYLISEDKIRQITSDHSLVAEFVKQGKITQKEAESHPKKNIITRALGTNYEVSADIFEIDIERNFKLMLCSDGLTNHLNNEEILRIINNNTENCAEKLIDMANKKGGTDNITVIIAEIGE